MKKNLMTIALVLLVALGLNAQELKTSGKIGRRGYVDLGLPSGLLWATCNIGATRPEGYGDYFAWGERSPKSKYDYETYFLEINEDISGNAEYDVATFVWGSEWRMPKISEFEELLQHCKRIEDYDYKGVTGDLFTGPNGNTLFLPYSGYCSDEETAKGILGLYHTSQPNPDDRDDCMLFNSYKGMEANPKSWGFVVRAVTDVTAVKSKSSDPKVEAVDGVDTDKYVDLGLPSGTLWAKHNIGTTKPEGYGDYFAWAELSPKSSYSKHTYELKFTGDISGKAISDVATNVWGSEWQLPTKAQFDELIRYCKSQITKVNGVEGRMVTGPNGNTIFFPYAGYYHYNELWLGGVSGNYMSSTSDEINPGLCYVFNPRLELEPENKVWGYSVRPVINKKKTTAEAPKQDVDPDDYVDLGLSVKWAKCDLGAYAPEAKGDLYAWGETRYKTEFYSNQCRTQGSSTIGDISGDKEYDAARVRLGEPWRLPTHDEMQELIDRCSFEYTKVEGVWGFLVTGPNGKTMFMPVIFKKNKYNRAYIYYWTGTPDTDNPRKAYILYVMNGNSREPMRLNVVRQERYVGIPIRAVFE